MGMRLGILGLVIACVAVPLAVAAGDSNVETKLKIIASRTNPDMESPAEFDMNGKITVAHPNREKKRCVRHRTVRVYKELPNGEAFLEGETKTNRRGNWFVAGDVAASLANGTYFAKTPNAVRGGLKCSADRSKDHVIDYDSF